MAVAVPVVTRDDHIVVGGKQDVCRLDVAMDNLLLVGIIERERQFPDDANRGWSRKGGPS